jgi:hypothetical protein
MGTSVQWYAVQEPQPSAFPDCPWALQFREETCQRTTRGDWDWETGMQLDQVDQFEQVRDHALRVTYGNWAFLKNHAKQKEKYAKWRLAWVAYVGGKRESRRLLGDVILCQQDAAAAVLLGPGEAGPAALVELLLPDPGELEPVVVVAARGGPRVVGLEPASKLVSECLF